MRVTSVSLIALILSSGCRPPRASEVADSGASWTASAALIAERSLGGAVPAAYASRALGTVAQELEQQRSSAAAQMAGGANDTPLLRALASARAATVAADSAVMQSDTSALLRALGVLRAQHATLDSLRTNLRGRQ